MTSIIKLTLVTMLNRLKNIYEKSPFLIKNIYSYIPLGIKYGKVYRYWKKIIDQKVVLQRDPRETLEYAINNCVFYRELYKNANLDEWCNVPLIDKETIQAGLTSFDNNKINKLFVTTGGVTGKPAKFYQSNNVWYKEMAFVYGFFKGHGYTPPTIKASFRGGDFSSLKYNTYWVRNPHHFEVNFSPFHINDNTIISYIKELNRLKPLYFHGYPSAFLSLAKHMKNAKLKLNYKPKCFFLISEGYTKKEISYLESVFECSMCSFYGQSERVVFAVADKDLEQYSVDQNYGYFELVDKAGNIVEENNIEGEIVATSYDNTVMPLIRYRTGDFTSYINHEKKIFKKISGKWGQQHLYGFNSEQISLTALNLHSEELNNVIKIQFIQKELGYIDVLVMLKKDGAKSTIKKIEQSLNDRVINVANFCVKKTDEFIKSSRGKSPLIISKIVKHEN